MSGAVQRSSYYMDRCYHSYGEENNVLYEDDGGNHYVMALQHANVQQIAFNCKNKLGMNYTCY